MIDPNVADQTINRLFEQLGLEADDQSIQSFIDENRPLAPTIALADADFWTSSQSHFIREAIAQDAEWALVVGKFDTLLRK